MGHSLVNQRISQLVSPEDVVDVYRIVRQLRQQFPAIPADELIKAVSEEVIQKGANAVWDPR